MGGGCCKKKFFCSSPVRRSVMSPGRASGSSLSRGVARQTSVESFSRARSNEPERHSKREKSNAIVMLRAVMAIESDDAEPLAVALRKGLEAQSIVSYGAFANTDSLFTLLDIALMLSAPKCCQVLISHGARESRTLNSLEARKKAVEGAIRAIEERKETIKSAVSSTKEYDKQTKQLNTHQALFIRMEKTLATPQTVELRSAKIEASSAHSVLITPDIAPGQPPATIVKYKIEWSATRDFAEIAGSRVVTDVERPEFEVTGVDAGQFVSFRVAAGTVHDYGAAVVCAPAVVEMSSWEEVTGERDTREQQLEAVQKLTEEVERHRDSVVWQRVYPKVPPQKEKKKKGIMDRFISSSKFLKNATNGCHFAALVYCEGKVLCTLEDCLPTFLIDESITTINKEDIQWLLKLSLSWDQLSNLSEVNPSAITNNSALSFRTKVVGAAADMMSSLGLKDIGRLAQPITHENAVFLVTVRYVASMEQIPAITTQWLTFEKMLRKRNACSAMDKVLRESVSVMNFFESSQIPLQRGLYVAYLKMHSSLSSIRLVVPDNLPSVLPYVAVRPNPHVTKDEWEWIKAIDNNVEMLPSAAQRAFHRQLSKSIHSLLHDLDVDPDLVPGHRMLTSEILRLSKDVTMILILPKPEDVCSAPTGSSHAADVHEQRRGCTSISVSVFEMIHLSTYCPTFISAYCKLSIFLEHFIMITQFEQRKCLLEADVKIYRTQLETLTEFSRRLDLVWGESRWVSRVGSLARDKTAKSSIPLSRLLAPTAFSDDAEAGYSDLFGPDRPDLFTPLARFPRPQSMMGSSPSMDLGDVERFLTRRRHRSTERVKVKAPLQPLLSGTERGSAVIIVFGAFDAGLENGSSSVRLSIAPPTTSAEIVALVVEQLTKSTARAAGAPMDDVVMPDFDEFCLVVVIGSRERRLRDDFAILKLQSPWNAGKIFVRRKDNVCSAVKRGNEEMV